MADLLYERDGDVGMITLNRPDIGNRVSDPMAGELAERIDAAAKESRLILFRSAGEEFCLGRDSTGRPAAAIEAYDVRGRSEVVFNCYDAFRRSKVPIIGVVQGKAVGFGCALAALCDITLASEKARFQLPEMSHNIMPTIAMSALIDRVARKALMHLVYSTDEIDARHALSIGLVSAVYPPHEMDAAVSSLIGKLKKPPLPALMAVKEYASYAYSMDTQSANDFAKNLHATINSSSKMRP
jgi:enoyl-CoA hydratase